MALSDITNKMDRDLRHYRTSIAARLLAQHPLHKSNADVWADVARAWNDLAELLQYRG